MTLSPPLQTARQRLAQHYINKLRQANTGIRKGQGNRSYWLQRVEQDWGQIKHWQAWSAAGIEQDIERARLCATFPIVTSDVLRVRQTPSEQLIWASQALAAIRNLGDSETELTLLYQVAMLSLTVEALDEADQHAQHFMERAQAAQDILNLGRAWYVWAAAAFTRGTFDKAEEYFTKCLPLLEACDAADEMPLVWRGLGRLAQFRGDYEQARINYLRFLDAATAVGNEQSVLDANVALSGIHLSLHDYPAADAYAHRAVALARNFGMSRWFPPALLSLAHAQKWLGKYESACSCYEEAITAARSISAAPSTVVNGLYGLGQARFLCGDYAVAAAHFEEALPIAREAQLPLRICEVLHDMVFVYIARNELQTARARLLEALESAQHLGTPHFLAKTVGAAITLWHYSGEHLQAAIWGGLLMHYTQNLHPSLFDTTIYERLEAELGAEPYYEALEQSKALTLDGVVSEVFMLLEPSNEGLTLKG